MLLSELLIRKQYIRMQIEEFKTYLKCEEDGVFREKFRYEEDSVDVNKIISKIFELEDRLQKYVMILDKVNRDYKVKIGSNDVSVATAVRLREVVKRKIDSLTDLMKNARIKIDILDLMQQRATLMEEYIIYDRAINLNDWSTNVD